MNRVNENISGIQRFQREEWRPGWKKRGRKAGRGGGGGGGQKRRPYRCLLPPADTQALPDFTLELQGRKDWNSALPETRPDQNGTRIQTRNQTRTEPEFKFSAKQVIGLQLSAQAEVLQLDSWVQETQMRKRKKGRTGRVKKRKEKRKEREVSNVSCSLPAQDTLTSCPCQEETRDKRVPVAAAGSGPIGWQAGP